jgi:hypothetical protein
MCTLLTARDASLYCEVHQSETCNAKGLTTTKMYGRILIWQWQNLCPGFSTTEKTFQINFTVSNHIRWTESSFATTPTHNKHVE